LIALSEQAMQAFVKTAPWPLTSLNQTTLFWTFFYDAQRDKAVDIYLKRGYVSADFAIRFEHLRDDLAKKLRDSATSGSGRAAPRSFTKAAARTVSPPSALTLYIESNRTESMIWRAIGEVARECWHALPPKWGAGALRVHGLPFDVPEALRLLKSADGVILLWDRKQSATLIDQIRMVEQLFPDDRYCPPGLVAYLSPPQPESAAPVPGWGWPVLRFVQPSDREVNIVEPDRGDLQRFLLSMLDLSVRRQRDGEI
jgi:hypothetical protein